MKHGCMVITLRLSSSRRSGSRQIHRGRKKALQVRSNVKSMLIVVFDIQGSVHKEFVPSGQAVNGKFYCEVLKLLKEGIRRKYPDKWKNNSWFLHHDKAPAHTSLVVRQFLTSKNNTVISHPLPIRLTSPPATFSYSPRWNYGCKGVVLTRLRRSTQNRKRLSTHSHLRISRDAWNHGKYAGIVVYMPKGTTSKETVETRSYGKNLFLWSNSPNFWVAPRKLILRLLSKSDFKNCIIHPLF